MTSISAVSLLRQKSALHQNSNRKPKLPLSHACRPNSKPLDHGLSFAAAEARFWDDAFYSQLQQRAAGLLRNQNPQHLAEPEDLIHEAYVRLATSASACQIKDRDHYLAIATRTLKRCLIDRVRSDKTVKRFGQLTRESVLADLADSKLCSSNVLLIADLLEKCSLGRRPRHVAQMYFLEQLTVEEIGSTLKYSCRTIKRDIREIVIALRAHFEPDSSQLRKLTSTGQSGFRKAAA